MNRVRLAFESTGNIDLRYGFRAVPLDVLINYAFDIIMTLRQGELGR